MNVLASLRFDSQLAHDFLLLSSAAYEAALARNFPTSPSRGSGFLGSRFARAPLKQYEFIFGITLRSRLRKAVVDAIISAQEITQSRASFLLATKHQVQVSTSRLTKPLDYPRVKPLLLLLLPSSPPFSHLLRVVGCKHDDLGQSSAGRFDYGDNLPRLPFPSFCFSADSSARRK